MSCACVLHSAMSSSAFHIMSSCASHLHTCSSHASEHFPRCPFCNPALLCHPAPPFTYFRVRVLNFLGTCYLDARNAVRRGLCDVSSSLLSVHALLSFLP